jgi:hydroxymethylbilane synthase
VNKIVLGTRGSALALWQARHVASRLREAHPGLTVEEKIIHTEGDRNMTVLGASSARGVFVREIEEALLSGAIDLAVHSLKDLPTAQPEGLSLAAISERHDPRDAILSPEGYDLESLPEGAVLGTGSFRRRCQILSLRPDLKVVPVRGNLQTRLRKLREHQFDALVLALAGVERLGIDEVPVCPIPEDQCLPAVGQGVLGLEIRQEDSSSAERLAVLDHGPTRQRITAERSFLHRLGGGCLAPATGFAEFSSEGILIRAVVGDIDGTTLLRDRETGSVDEAEAIGVRLAGRLLEAGAAELLEQAREASEG